MITRMTAESLPEIRRTVERHRRRLAAVLRASDHRLQALVAELARRA